MGEIASSFRTKETMLIADSITYRYPNSSVEVFGSGVSLAAEASQLTAIVGQSGSGKSTLLACLAGVLSPQHGEISLDRRILASNDDTRNAPSRILVLQNSSMFERLTIWQNVALAWGWPGRRWRALACEHLSELGVGDLADQLPSRLSLGQRQRAAIATAVAQEPRVLLADEPTGSLDEDNSLKVVALLRHLAKKGNIVVVGTHDAQIMQDADVVLQMNGLRGRLAER
jgi:ABC-type lipoprotein export system ATPase subunit